MSYYYKLLNNYVAYNATQDKYVSAPLRIKTHRRTEDWSPIGIAAFIPFYGNVLNYDYTLYKKTIRGRDKTRAFYRIKRNNTNKYIDIVETRELNSGDIVHIANATNPFSDKVIIYVF